MPVNAKWITVDGEQRMRITIPGNPAIVITQDQAWELTTEIRWLITAYPPDETEEK